MSSSDNESREPNYNRKRDVVNEEKHVKIEN
jgi:hypothetical protein